MKLKKVIINGKEYFTEDAVDGIIVDAEIITDNNEKKSESKDDYIQKAEAKFEKYLGKVDDNHQEVKDELRSIFNDFISDAKDEDDISEIKELYDDFLDDLEDEYGDYVDDLEDEEDEDDEDDEEINGHNFTFTFNKDFGKRIMSSINNAFSSKSSKKGSSKTNKLLALFPFMSKEDIHECLMKILNDDVEFSSVNITALMPFVSKEDADMLVELALNGNKKIDIISIAPFVSQETLSKVVDKYINGEIEKFNINALYPFLSQSDLKRLFNFIINQKEE